MGVRQMVVKFSLCAPNVMMLIEIVHIAFCGGLFATSSVCLPSFCSFDATQPLFYGLCSGHMFCKYGDASVAPRKVMKGFMRLQTQCCQLFLWSHQTPAGRMEPRFRHQGDTWARFPHMNFPPQNCIS